MPGRKPFLCIGLQSRILGTAFPSHDKTKAEAEEKGELIQELEDIPEASTRNDDEEPSEAELCECCGEKRRGDKASRPPGRGELPL